MTKIVARFEIISLKYFDTENLNLILKVEQSGRISATVWTLVLPLFNVKHYFSKWSLK